VKKCRISRTFYIVFYKLFHKISHFFEKLNFTKGSKRCKISCKKVTTSHTTKCEILAKNTKFSRNDFPISLETLLIMKLKMQVRKIYEPRFNITLQSSQRALVIICSRLYTGLPTNNETVKTT